ncbi:MAG: hypothetical protein KGM83_11275 [Betaproteobacteria bacterium]|nr:hypothetical protein [Betaproteobacteria bacterium]
MAEADLATKPSESQRLYSAWRRSMAEWELAQHGPDNVGRDLPEEDDARHCSATHAALMAFLLHPAADLGELAHKLKVAERVEAHEFGEPELMAAFADDAHRLAHGTERRRTA